MTLPVDMSHAAAAAQQQAIQFPPQEQQSEPTWTNPPKGTHDPHAPTVLVGGGPRTDADVHAIATFAAQHRQDIEQLQDAGAFYHPKIVTVANTHDGSGEAWGAKHGDGAMNTRDGWGDSKQLVQYAKQHQAAIDESLEHNPVIQALFRSQHDTIQREEPPPSAYLTRAHAGQAEHKLARDAVREARAAVPNLEFQARQGMVTSVTADDPHQPVIRYTDPHGGEHSIDASGVKLNLGTTLRSPLEGLPVDEHFHTGHMNPGDVAKYFESRGLMQTVDGENQLRPGTKFIIGGTVLSALDAITAAQNSMGGKRPDGSQGLFKPVPFSEDPHGWVVDPEVASRYKDAITLISRRPDVVPPRVDPDLTYHPPAGAQPLMDWREAHAGDYQNTLESHGAINNVLDASQAVHLGTTPQGLNPKRTFAENLQGHHEQAMRSMEIAQQLRTTTDPAERAKLQAENSNLEAAVRRQTAGQHFIGTGLSSDLGATMKEIADEAPHTLHGSEGYTSLNGRAARIGQIDGDNRKLVDAHNARMEKLVAAPPTTQDQFDALHKAGVLRHVEADYKSLGVTDDGKILLTLPDGQQETFDAGLVSKVFDPRTPLTEQMASHFDRANPQSKINPALANHRRMTLDGVSTNVMHYGVNRHENSKTDHAGNPLPDGGVRAHGGSYVDTNNASSAHVEVARNAPYLMGKSALQSAGVTHPAALMDRMFDTHRPTEKQVDDEFAGFARDYGTLMAKNDYLENARRTAGKDPVKYHELVAALPAHLASEAGQQAIATHMANYQPPPGAQFLKNQLDIPAHTHQKVYADAQSASLGLLNLKQAVPTTTDAFTFKPIHEPFSASDGAPTRPNSPVVPRHGVVIPSLSDF